ncbi:MAG: class I SAM-dependent methyltransferase [Propionicimonas sp.]|uniref:class I SAM-dependent methyltransferase n=1 Tax=Propionicimonas sp. TaxID=1955623 RepID=UPI003D151AFA
MSQPHEARGMAESFGVDPARYDRARPEYPADLLARVIAALPGTEVLDVGSGTGILARQLAAAGCLVRGVEPDARMAAFARDSGVDVDVARFEDWNPEGRSFDGVLAGTAWHWIDPGAGATKAADVLRPGGLLAPLWNVATPDAAVAAAFADAFADVVPDAPFDLRGRAGGAASYQPVLDRAADGIRAEGRFTDPEQWSADWEVDYSRDEWLDQLRTSGAMTRLDAAQQAAVLDRVAATIDAGGGTVRVAWTCLALVATRT